MLFDPNPKVRKKDLYNRKVELDELFKSIQAGERLVVITAPRRMGKTSLLNVCLSTSKKPYLKIDAEGLLTRGMTTHDLLKALEVGLSSKFPRRADLLGFLKNRRGYRVERSNLYLDPQLLPLDVLSDLNNFSRKSRTRFLVGIDEAQYLRYGKRVDHLLAHCIDEFAYISFILTGSEVGILHDFLGIDDPKAPLYGRRAKLLIIRRLTGEESLDFLRMGFRELRIPIDERVLREAVSKLDGIVGWLAHFGYSFAIERSKLESFVERATKMVESELNELEKRSSRYKLILEAIASGVKRWTHIYTWLSVRAGPISRSNFDFLLENLIKMGFVKKTDDLYEISDPIVEEYLKRGS